MIELCGLIYGSDRHHLDHLAPLCALLGIPLVLTDDALAIMAKHYYPDLLLLVFSPLTIATEIVERFKGVISSLPKQLIDPLFFFEERKMRKKMLFLWVGHGNSDKDHLEALTEEMIVLAYGEQMAERLPRGLRLAYVGNYRALYYHKHKDFYRKLLAESLYFPADQTTILYAPTWGGTLIKPLHFFLEELPSSYNVLIKLHPNTLEREPALYEQAKERSLGKSHIQWVEKIPVIYPLLERADCCVVDYSSIAYDFLYFNKPLYFFSEKEAYIERAGVRSSPQQLLEAIGDEDRKERARKEVYLHAFKTIESVGELVARVSKVCQDALEEDIHFL